MSLGQRLVGRNLNMQPVGSKMKRVVLAAGLVIAAMSFDVRPASATEGPWCAFINLGNSSTYEDCQYRSIEECRRNVISGNRGFCNHNPRWVDAPAAKPRKRNAQRS